MPTGFFDLVEDKVRKSAEVGGWKRGPLAIIDEAADECVDAPAWLRGLDTHPKPAGVDDQVRRIQYDAALLWHEIQKLREMYVR